MAGPIAELLFWTLVVATAVAHVFILRSTIRGMRADARARGMWEWVWAVLPAACLILLFVWTWHTRQGTADSARRTAYSVGTDDMVGRSVGRHNVQGARRPHRGLQNGG